MKMEKVFRMPYLTNLAEAKELAKSVEEMAAEFAANQLGPIWIGHPPCHVEPKGQNLLIQLH